MAKSMTVNHRRRQPHAAAQRPLEQSNFPRLIGIVTDFERLFDTFMPAAPASQVNLNHSYILQPRSTALFRWTPRGQGE
jgi:hypothetical protein